MQSESANLINLLCQPQTTAKTIPTRNPNDSSFIISELKFITTGLTLILENQKLILQHQKDIADQLQIDLKDPRPAIGTSRRFQKKAYYTLASFLGILMVLGFVGIIIAIHGHHLRLAKSG